MGHAGSAHHAHPELPLLRFLPRDDHGGRPLATGGGRCRSGLDRLHFGMADVPIALSGPFAAFVDEKVRSGEFRTREEVVEEALSLLQTDAEKLKRLREAIQEGLDDFDAGRYVEVDDIGAWLNTLGRDTA